MIKMYSIEKGWGFHDMLGWPLLIVALLSLAVIFVLFVIGIFRRLRGVDPSSQRVCSFMLSALILLMGLVSFGGNMAKALLRLATAQRAGGIDYGNIFAHASKAHSRLSACALVAFIGVLAGFILWIVRKKEVNRQQEDSQDGVPPPEI